VYRRLFDIHMSEKNEDRKKALKLMTFWDKAFSTRIDVSAYENLMELFLKEKEYNEALGVLKISKKNGQRPYDLEILLLLKLGKYGSIIPVFRDAFAANYSIKEKVGISVVQKLFELTRIEEKRIADITSKYMGLIETGASDSGSDPVCGSSSSSSSSSGSASCEEVSLTPEESKLVAELTENITMIIGDIEEITSNLVYLERGDVRAFSKMIRLWREGGEIHKERLQVG
jgi:hypothetical protein